MHMNQSELGDVLMLPNGELVVYWTVLHATIRSYPRGDSDAAYFFQDTPDLYLGRHDIQQCQCVGSLEAAFAGFVKLCRPSGLSEGVDRFAVCNGDKIHHANLFLTEEAAQEWIDAGWGGAGNRSYWVAKLTVQSPARPWRYADGSEGP